METKKCCMCQNDLTLDKFKKNKRHTDGLQSHCADCHKTYRRQHYEKNRQKYIDKAVKSKQRFFVWWKEYKSQFSCVCGENHPACIDFHHTHKNKEAEVSALVSLGCKQKVLKEIAKCVPMCSNCHRKLHWNAR